MQNGDPDVIVTIEDEEVLVNGKPANLMTQEMIDFSTKIKHIDYIRYSMVEFTWTLIDRFLPDHPVHASVAEIKQEMQPTIGQVLCKLLYS